MLTAYMHKKGVLSKQTEWKPHKSQETTAFLKIGVLMKSWLSIYAQIGRFIKTDYEKPRCTKKLQRFRNSVSNQMLMAFMHK